MDIATLQLLPRSQSDPNTIDPDAWRDIGGNASIHYYQPGRVLVINGSQRTHEQTRDLLWKLRVLN